MPPDEETQDLFELHGDVQTPRKLDADPESLTETYGQFFAQPFERGFATTIGNSLRRTLLSSIEGAAITAVKIEGVEHEFASIKGVAEDATDIILNLKRVPVALRFRHPTTVKIAKEGPCEVTSADIQTEFGVEVLDPTIHIAKLDEGASLNVEMRVKRARGYVPAARNFDDGLPLGYIPIDSVHTPVKKVNFKVEPARVRGEELERLTIEIWTDGSLRPQDALALAANFIQQQMSMFVNVQGVSNEGPLRAETWIGYQPPSPEIDRTTRIQSGVTNDLLASSFSALIEQLQQLSTQDVLLPTVREAVQDESTARNYVTKRYRSLIDRKYMSGLSQSENDELDALQITLEEMDKPYYEAIINRLRNLIEQSRT